MEDDTALAAALKERSAAGRLFKPRLERSINFYFCVRPDKPQRGGNAMARMHQIVDSFISSDGYLYVAYRLTTDTNSNELGQTRFTRFVKLIPLPQDQE
jgi:hypothetical protein